MRGGAIPLVAWGLLLLILAAGNAIWNGKAVPAATAGFATLVILGSALALWRSERSEALRRGPPGPDPEPQAVPQASPGAVLAALAFAAILFGLVWASFLVYFGAAVFAAALGRIAAERRAQHRSRRELEDL